MVAKYIVSVLRWQQKSASVDHLLSTAPGRLLVALVNYLIWPIIAAAIFVIYAQAGATVSLSLVLSLVVSQVIETIFKYFFPSTRPSCLDKSDLPFSLSRHFPSLGSFPSGHTAKTLILLIFILKFTALNPIIATFLAFTLILSRIAFGYHYPLDIVGGVAVGALSWFTLSQVSLPSWISRLWGFWLTFLSSEVAPLTAWWFTIFLFGLAFLPLTFKLFSSFWDKGYIFTKTIALISVTYLVFVLGVLRLAPFTTTTIFIITLIAGFINYRFLADKEFKKAISSHLYRFISLEILFIFCFLIWSFVRSFSPDIESLEKFMDWGFVNSALRSHFLPPSDMWYSGYPINYYYFGHLIFALIIKVSTVASAIGYNLSVATLFALTFTSAFSLASNFVFTHSTKFKLRRVILAGLLSALLLTLGGNLHAVYKIAKINIKNEGRLVLTRAALDRAAKSYWYPDATRFIGFDPETDDKTIHEFPLYSFVVADLHGHMNDIPIVILFVAVIFALVSRRRLSFLGLVVPAGFILSVAYMTNAWDFAVYGLFVGLFLFLFYLRRQVSFSLIQTFTRGLAIIFFWFIFSLPFSLHFTPMTQGLMFSDAHSPFCQLFILYGGFWLITLPFIIVFLFRFLRHYSQSHLNDIFIVSLILTATLLIVIPEIGYIKDIYIYEHRRANTMFKLVYQAFILYSLTAGFVFVYLSRLAKPLLVYLYKGVFLVILTAHLIYPYFAIKSYYGLTNYSGLWGLNFLKKAYPDNLSAINWLNSNISGQPIVLEAAGDSYTTYNQVSMATGLPTVEGWIVHEWLWRGGYDEPGARASDVAQIYESTNLQLLRSLIQKYNIDYIFLGAKEYEKYSKLNEAHIASVAVLVAQFGDTKIYKIQK